MSETNEKNKWKKFSFFVASLALVFLTWGNTARAENKIDVEDLNRNNISNKNIFSESNIYPGWETSKTIVVKNKSATDEVNLFFTFKTQSDEELTKKLKLYVVRVHDNNYRIGGAGDKYTLKEADRDSLYVDRIEAEGGKQYKIKIKFDKDAGNEYQKLETKFDIDFTIEPKVASPASEEEILASQGRVVTGKAPTEEVQGEQTKKDNKNNQSGLVSGARKNCQSLPQWIWILAFVIFILGFIWDARRNYKKGEYGWKFAVAWTAVALIFGYLADFCHQYRWFLYAVILSAIGIHFIYLNRLKKKVVSVKK